MELPRNLIIGEDPVADARRFYRSEGGITLVTRKMLVELRKKEPQLFTDFDSYKADFIQSY